MKTLHYIVIIFLTCTQYIDTVGQEPDIGEPIYPFCLSDGKGNKVRPSDFHGKVVVIDFWYTGCGGCAGFYRNWLKPLEEEFEHGDEVLFLSVSTDKDLDIWKQSVKKGIYTSEKAVNVYLGPAGFKHPFITTYEIDRYPHMMIVNREGRIAEIVKRPKGFDLDNLRNKILDAL